MRGREHDAISRCSWFGLCLRYVGYRKAQQDVSP